MRVKTIVDEDFLNYKKPSMYIATCFCDFKCCIEQGIDEKICQNHDWIKNDIIHVDNQNLIKRYLDNPITHAIVFSGLEPIAQFKEIESFINALRATGCLDDVVIYTGYDLEEIEEQVIALSVFPNIIFKFGRFKTGFNPHYDEVLGIKLASPNQYGKNISLPNSV